MNVLIIEDESLAVEKLKQTLNAVDKEAVIVGTAGSIDASVHWLKENDQPDLILMDIELSDGQSFEIFKRFPIKSPVIFTTSYDEYALKAFKVKSIDYLLKPIEEDDLRYALAKYRDMFTKQEMQLIDVPMLVREIQAQLKKTEFRERFLVKVGQRFVTVDVEDISYFFVNDRIYQFVTRDGKKYTVDYTLDELEAMLDPARFFRTGRSYLVHLRSIQQIHSYFNGKLKLQLTPTLAANDVVISKEKAGEFKKWMGR